MERRWHRRAQTEISGSIAPSAKVKQMTIETKDNCVFCEIIFENAPAQIVERHERVLIFKPLSPVIDGHVLVVPTKHVKDAGSRPSVTAHTMWRASIYAAKNFDSFNIITSVGKA